MRTYEQISDEYNTACLHLGSLYLHVHNLPLEINAVVKKINSLKEEFQNANMKHPVKNPLTIIPRGNE